MTIAQANGRRRTRCADTMPHDRPAEAVPMPEITLCAPPRVPLVTTRDGRPPSGVPRSAVAGPVRHHAERHTTSEKGKAWANTEAPRSPSPAQRSPHPETRTTCTPAEAVEARSPRHDHHSPYLDQHDTPTEDHLTPTVTCLAHRFPPSPGVSHLADHVNVPRLLRLLPDAPDEC